MKKPEVYLDMDEVLADDLLNQLQDDSDKEHLDEILPKVESWVTTNNKDFFNGEIQSDGYLYAIETLRNKDGVNIN